MLPNSRINCRREKERKTKILVSPLTGWMCTGSGDRHGYLRNFDVIRRSSRGFFVVARVELQRPRQNRDYPWKGVGGKEKLKTTSHLVPCAAGWEVTTHASCSCSASCTWSAWRAGWCWWGSGLRCSGWSGTTRCPVAGGENNRSLESIPNRKCVALLGFKIGKTYNNNGKDDHEG